MKSIALTRAAISFGGGIILLSAFFWIFQASQIVQAADITVDTNQDEADGSCLDDCSLRDAISVANPGDNIIIPADTYTLTINQLIINKNLTLSGSGAGTTIIKGNAISRVLQISGGTVLIADLTVTNGSETNGGGISISGINPNVTISNTIVTGNTASGNGGGIHLASGSLTLANSQVFTNTAADNGGGIYNNQGTITLLSSDILSNTADAGGGLFINQNTATLAVSGGTIAYNNALDPSTSGGGGIATSNGTVTIDGAQIKYNTAVFRGGGLAVINGKVTFNSGQILSNTALYGGGLYVAFSNAVFTQTGGTIEQNHANSPATFGGGGLFVLQGKTVFAGGKVISNTAANHGGGMEIRFGTAIVDGGQFINNSAGNLGGAIYNTGATLTINDAVFKDNHAGVGGGAIAADTDTNPSNTTITNSAFYSNTAEGAGDGGGIYNGGIVTLNNMTLSGNAANDGAGLYNTGVATATLTNVTVHNNNATGFGGGLSNQGNVISIANTIIAGNSAGTGPDCSGTITSQDYNLIQNSTNCTLIGTTTNNISGDPLLSPLALNDGPTPNHALDPSSPAIDAADNGVCPATDQRGNLRPIDGDSNGTATCDIGAYEYGIGFFINDSSVTEGDGSDVLAIFTVTRSFVTDTVTTVDYDLTAGTAVSGTDYTYATGSLSFAGNDVTQTIAISVTGDLLDEDDETFFVNLSNPSTNAYLGDSEAQGTILDNDPEPMLSIGDATVTEGDAPGTVTATFTVTLSAVSGRTVSAGYVTADNTAVSTSDYVTQTGTVSFDPGQLTQEIEIVVNGDDLDEIDETFFVNLNNPINATIGDGQGEGTITDNDNPPTITISDTAVTEVDGAATTTATFTVTLSASSGKTISATYSTAAGSATADVDYQSITSDVTFVPGVTMQTIEITVNGDDTDEDDETFSVNLSDLTNVDPGDTSAEGTILDNDAPPDLSIADTAVIEGNAGTVSAVFTVTLSAASEKLITVDYDSANNSATEPDDYIAVSDTLNFTVGTTEQTITVDVNGDTTVEGNETFFINLSGATNAGIDDGQGEGTIIDDETVPLLSISDAAVTEVDSPGTVMATFTVTMSLPSSNAVTVTYTTANDTAVANGDYQSVTNDLVFGSNETSKTIDISVNGDDIDEITETFFVNLSNPQGASIDDGQGIGTITDNDAPPSISIADTTVTEVDAGDTSTAVFTLTLSIESGKTISATYSVTAGSATPGDDYVDASATITFAPGETMKTIEITINGDDDVEDAETFTVTLDDLDNVTAGDVSAQGTITDNDDYVVFVPIVINGQ